MTHPYATRAFAESLSHWGRALEVPAWGCHVIVRDIANDGEDAAGVYPITPIIENADITAGLQQLKKYGLVSVVLVLDDFHRPALEQLSKHFTKVLPFKPHYIYRPPKGPMEYDSHHKRALKKAMNKVKTGVVDLKHDGAGWQTLYDALIAKLKLSGLHAFPHTHHDALARMDEVIAVGAWLGNELVSCHVWVRYKDRLHSHLIASNEAGYDTRAAYAVNQASIKMFADAELLNFGGGAGNSVDADDGLARFKRGFSNDTASSYLCSAVLDQERYDTLVAARKFTGPVTYFPAYRAP